MKLPYSKYWPLTPGSYIEYRAFIVSGIYIPAEMRMDIWKRELDTNTPVFRRTCVEVPQRRTPEIAVVTSNSGHVPTINDDWTDYVLYQQLWDDGKQPAFIGETGNHQVVGVGPPDPLVTINPVVGETFTVTVRGLHFDVATGKVQDQSLVAKYKTRSIGAHWWTDRFPDTCLTALEERPDTFKDNWIYNYLWAKGIGPVDLWWGLRNKDNTWSGFEWQCVGYSNAS